MTPKEKANELFNKFISINLSQVNDLVDGIRIALAKRCALMSVAEILELMDKVASIESNNFRGTETNGYVTAQTEEEYWLNVKIEIEKL